MGDLPLGRVPSPHHRVAPIEITGAPVDDGGVVAGQGRGGRVPVEMVQRVAANRAERFGGAVVAVRLPLA
jgi:hypothetical protein